MLQLPPSMRHSKVEPASEELNEKVGVRRSTDRWASHRSSLPEPCCRPGGFTTRLVFVLFVLSVATARTSYWLSETAVVSQLAV
jgi:hypothetical protein